MSRVRSFAEGLGVGAFLFSIAAAATCFLRPEAVASWLARENDTGRARRLWNRAERAAKSSPGYLDACRAAGL